MGEMHGEERGSHHTTGQEQDGCRDRELEGRGLKRVECGGGWMEKRRGYAREEQQGGSSKEEKQDDGRNEESGAWSREEQQM